MSAGSAAEAQAFDLAGFRGEVVPELESVLHTQVLHDPMAVAQAGESLRPSMSRLTSRVVLPDYGTVLLKVHRIRSSTERMQSLVRRSRAHQEYRAARFLDAAGLPVAQPLAYGEQRRGGMLHASFFIAAFLPNVRPVHEVLPVQPADKRRALLGRLSVLIRAMHDAGFDHRDLHSGNVLAGPGPGDACALYLTDLHRSRMGASVPRAARLASMARWLHSLQAVLTPEEWMVVLDRYQTDGGRCELPTADVMDAVRKLERRRRASRGKRCFKESTVYTRDVGAGRGARRRDLSLERLEAVLRAHDREAQPGRPGLAKAGRKGVVTRHGDIVVKERRAASAFGRLRDRLAPQRHAAGYRHAHMLGVLGVGTAKPLAFVQRDGRTFTLFEDLSKLPRLDHLARELYAGSDRRRQVALREASALWLGALHAGGVYHGDLKGVNVLVEEGPRVVGFRVIDTDHCRFFPYPKPVDARRCVKNLAQLAASIPVSVTRSERLRWYRLYRHVAPAPMKDTRAVASEVAAALAQKIVVLDEPIE